MPAIEVVFHEPAFSDYKIEDIIHLGNDSKPIKIALLEGGMTSGKPSIGIGIEIPGGKLVLVESSVELFLEAAALIQARYNAIKGE